MNNSGALLSVGLAFGVALAAFAAGWVATLALDLGKRWRYDRETRRLWTRLLK